LNVQPCHNTKYFCFNNREAQYFFGTTNYHAKNFDVMNVFDDQVGTVKVWHVRNGCKGADGKKTNCGRWEPSSSAKANDWLPDSKLKSNHTLISFITLL
jgi:hypothetical protein